MATVQTVIEKAYTKVNGEYEALSASSDDFKTYLNVLNQVVEKWWYTPYVKWQSLFNINYALPTPIAEGVFEYAIPDSDELKLGNSPFDHVFIMDDGVEYERYKLVDQAMYQNAKNGKICAFLNGKLYFKEISDEAVGLEIRLPAYVKPSAYTSGSQEVAIDSVSWLVTEMSAFICESSPVPFIARNAEKYHEEAKPFMKEMKENNRHRQALIIKSVGASNSPMSLSDAINMGVGIGGITGVNGGTF